MQQTPAAKQRGQDSRSFLTREAADAPHLFHIRHSYRYHETRLAAKADFFSRIPA